MTEWNASGYNRVSALQKWLADESLAAVDLAGSERVLDVGCGDGKITARSRNDCRRAPWSASTRRSA
jgi:trans-aconitate 2-methyltransferase